MVSESIIDSVIQVAGVEMPAFANFREFLDHRKFQLDRLAYERAVNFCVAEIYGETTGRRCRECDGVFVQTPRVDNALFCVDCLDRFDGGLYDI